MIRYLFDIATPASRHCSPALCYRPRLGCVQRGSRWQSQPSAYATGLWLPGAGSHQGSPSTAGPGSRGAAHLQLGAEGPAAAPAPAVSHLPGDRTRPGQVVGLRVGLAECGPRWGPRPGRAGLWGAGDRPSCGVAGAGAGGGPGLRAGGTGSGAAGSSSCCVNENSRMSRHW